MMVGSYRDCPVKGQVSIGKMTNISQRKINREIEFIRVFPGKLKHLAGKVNTIQFKGFYEGQEVSTVRTANIE